jgi:hypothetical protein
MEQKVAYAFDFPQGDQIPSPNCLDAYQLAMVISFPDIRESKGCVVQGFITQFHVGEDARSKEEGLGVKSEPQAP